MKRPLTFVFASCILFLFISGCTLGPNAARPISAADNAKPYTYASHPADAKLPDVDHWWKLFHDKPTNQLVARALKDNVDLRIATASVLESRAMLSAAIGSRLPSVDLSGGRDRSRSEEHTSELQSH